MAIFNNESQFYNHAAPPMEPGQPLFYRFVEFVVDHVFVLNIPVSILAYLLTSRFRAMNAFFAVGYIIGLYLTLIALPAILASLVASPALLAWRKLRTRLFNRIFEIVFAFLYLLLLLCTLIGSFPPSIK